ncbi:Co2+/Mg2+ efflux protein ApaG [Sphingobacterium shayense]|uniref:Co2+/Mg2+ efflux protein ApaG n=1 Tax=Sphingobacterium shayense TaxID=626343 RepID=UPI00155231EA|nr:Co2+/Mg2+ efflux protein ApaG [Sphingobacterium shayense]NQD71159.1 Co2+/Mg2+ efflux protein ApaG [Sphingobacterium shayense]
MTTQITAGVKISVEVVYQPEYSNPEKQHYMFSYQITIENMSEFTIQLLNRHWDIFDTSGERRTIDGEGVVGVQPVLSPGDVHQYVSGCNLNSEIGYMQGTYQMIKQVDGTTFDVEIPRFELIASFKLN